MFQWHRIQMKHYEDLVALENLGLDEALSMLEYAAYFSLLNMPVPSNSDLGLRYLSEDGLAFVQDDGGISITCLGALLLAKRLSQFPLVGRKALRIIRYLGKGRASECRERMFDQGYATAIHAAFEYLDGAMPSVQAMQGVRRETRTPYPQLAVRELLVNALMHQELSETGAGPTVEIFDSRVEFTNPGVPLVRIERIVNDPPQSRNVRLSALMRRFGYSGEAGSGWDTIIEGCEDYLLPVPRIDSSSGWATRVTLSAHKDYRAMMPQERLDTCYWHACVCYNRGESANNSSLRERFGLKSTSSSQVSRLLKEATEKQLIKPVDPTTSPRYMAYLPIWA